jgi:hypothetical protein
METMKVSLGKVKKESEWVGIRIASSVKSDGRAIWLSDRQEHEIILLCTCALAIALVVILTAPWNHMQMRSIFSTHLGEVAVRYFMKSIQRIQQRKNKNTLAGHRLHLRRLRSCQARQRLHRNCFKILSGRTSRNCQARQALRDFSKNGQPPVLPTLIQHNFQKFCLPGADDAFWKERQGGIDDR